MLNPKQLKFCQEYVLDHNASAAYVRAGYSAKNANVDGCKQLAKPSIKAEIARLEALAAEKYSWTREKAAKTLMAIVSENGRDRTQAVKLLNTMCGLDEPSKIQHSNDPNNPLNITLNFVGKKAPTNAA